MLFFLPSPRRGVGVGAPRFWAGAADARRWRLPASGRVHAETQRNKGDAEGGVPCWVCCALASFAPSRQEAKPQRRVAPCFSPPRWEG